ncbi:hypothetical protein BDB00DRAFT_961150 [Zychaea mexicana]|uniref:uncharacterized protein n=1 Tax=Zychaea mexicana TaxID=64656 RepID=UPI0022FE3539|nr:uncharacterized protein BDB00DRAFT_961150 [Zychaea mexicana]KAI9490354.1 hypothetical protein BDB00DRAFT_961150 [Zychaea mexicana]
MLKRKTHRCLIIFLLFVCYFTVLCNAWNNPPPQNDTTNDITDADDHHQHHRPNHHHTPEKPQQEKQHQINDDKRYDEPYDGPGIPAHMGVAAAFLMAFGVYLMAAGFRYFTITMGMVGFITGATITWVLLTAAEPIGKPYPHASIVFSFGCYGAGFLFAGVAMYFWKVTLYGLGLIGGYILAMYFWTWGDGLLIQNVYARHFASLGFGLAGIIALLLVEFAAVCILTSFLGAYLFMLGLDLVVHTYMVNGPRAMLDAIHHINYKTTPRIYAMLSGVLGLWIVSTLCQLILNRGNRFGLHLVIDEANKK